MKIKLLYAFLLVSIVCFSQNFTLNANSGILPVQYSSVAFADIDNDGFLDLFTVGTHPATPVARMYKNDRTGNFVMHDQATFIKKREGSSAFGDVNGDGFVDLIVSGSSESGVETKLYLNDAQGNFTLSPSSNFIGTMQGDILMGDFDRDGDIDVICSGMNNSSTFILAFYKNDGAGVFSRDTNSGLEQYGMYISSLKTADINNDGYLDLVTCGRTSVSATSKGIRCFLNNTNGTFSLASTPNITALSGKVALADVNNDGTIDLLIAGNGDSTGGNPANGFKMELYYNNGQANFTLANNMPFTGVGDKLSMEFGDVNNDGYPDILCMGRKYSATIAGNNEQKAFLYMNNGAAGGFTLVENIPFTSHSNGTITFADVDNDNDLDVLITGINTGTTSTAKLYLNDLNSLNVGTHERSFATIHPNPIQDVLNIDLVSTEKIATLQLYTLNGTQIRHENLSNPLSAVDLSFLSSGVYILALTSETGSVIRTKIIKR